ncbi:MAG: hypothetical protein HYU66_08805 [Armatimonadetes bacterium]|nr:hypothetical protein [Armatimonadota bacterium]
MLWCVVPCLLPVFAPPAVIPLDPGVTPLLELGSYRVAWSTRDGKRGEMPNGWTGHFESATGISVTNGPAQGGRPTLLQHCVWRGGAGPCTVDYLLGLPDVQPLRFVTAAAMVSDFVGKSDGVTFRAGAGEPGGTAKWSFEQHIEGAEWVPVEIDLSPWRGKAVLLRLEVDPGPKDNPSFDYSVWQDPRIEAGPPAGPGERLRQIQARSGVKAPSPTAGLLDRRTDGCCPGTALPGEETIRQDGASWVLERRDGFGRLTFTIPPAGLDAITAQVDDHPPFSITGGAEAALANGQDSGREVLGIARDGAALVLRERYSAGGQAAVVSTRIDLVEGAYVSVISDWTRSAASVAEAGQADYGATTAGRRAGLDETVYVAISPEPGEVLPNLPFAASPYRDELAQRVVFDVWGRGFTDQAALLREWASYGVEKLAIIEHVWQKGGYDNEYPDVLPPNAGLGGDAGLKTLTAACRELGYLFSVHENYIDFYPNAKSYDAQDLALDPAGKPYPAWVNVVQSYVMKPSRMTHYAEPVARAVHETYGTTASYLDVHTCIPPWSRVDYDNAVPGAAQFRQQQAEHGDLFALMRREHHGPLFGEGHAQLYWAGLCDGVEAQVGGGSRAPLILDFDLLKMHEQMVNHGMGYQERWLPTGYTANWGGLLMTPAEADRYRCTEVAYGHAGFISNQASRSLPLALREYHLVQPIQARCAAAKAVEILYEVDGSLVPLAHALAAGVTERVRVKWDSGLTVWVNRQEDEWTVDGHALPQDTFRAEGAGLEAWTARVDGVWCDYAATADQVYTDARTLIHTEESGPYAAPTVDSFEDLGNGRLRVRYAWQVRRGPAPDANAFVHFCPVGDPKTIRFQQDHATPKPGSQWQKGETVLDGPYEIQVPEDGAFTWGIGLYNAGGRLPVEGPSDGDGRVILGTVTRKDGKLTFTPQPPRAGAEPQRDYAARMNPEAKPVDFGAVKHNGVLYLRRAAAGWELIPIPRGREFEVEIRPAKLGLPATAALSADGTVVARAADGVVRATIGKMGVARYELR